MGRGPRAVEDMVEQRTDNPLDRDLNHVTAEMASLWADLRDARIFITGGTGFFGSWLLETLIRANDQRSLGARAMVLTRDAGTFRRRAPRLASHPAVELLEGDVRTFHFPAIGTTHVIHAAVDATGGGAGRERLREFDSTITGTRRVLDFARSAGAKRFLFTSSGSIYGAQPGDLLRMPETHSGGPDVTSPSSAGAEAKRAAEMLCALHGDSGLTTTVARCFTFVGPYLPLDDKFAVGNFIRDGLLGGPIRVSGDGSPVRSYMYAADLAIWLWTILLRGVSGRAYNVGSDAAISIAEVARAVAKRFAPPPQVSILGAPDSGLAGSRYVPDITRARDELGVRLTVDFDEALSRTIAWHTARTASPHVPH